MANRYSDYLQKIYLQIAKWTWKNTKRSRMLRVFPPNVDRAIGN